jgi:hypothetical protein
LVVGVALHKFLNLDGVAWESAQRFCASLEIGSSTHDLSDRAKHAGADLYSWPRDTEGKTKHVAWFGGFLANEHACNISELGGLIESRYAEEHKW